MVSINQVGLVTYVAPINAVAASETIDAVTPTAIPASPAFDARPPALSAEMAAIVLQEQGRVNKPVEPRSFYETFMPARDGFSSHVLAVGVENPDAISSSAGLQGQQIADDARARLDANYKKMADTGKAFDFNSGEDWRSLFGDFDRRSLEAVNADTEGKFTDQEHQMAFGLLRDQNALRVGGYSGPSRLFGTFLASGRSSMPREANEFLLKETDADAANDPSISSKIARATTRAMLGPDQSKKLFGQGTDPDDKMITLLADSIKTMMDKNKDFLSKVTTIRTVDELAQQDWFKNQITAFNAILQGGADNNAQPAPIARAA